MMGKSFLRLFLILAKIFGLVSSRIASFAIHCADLESSVRIFFASLSASLFKNLLRLPICLKAQLTAFLTKFLSSTECFFINGKKGRKSLSSLFLS